MIGRKASVGGFLSPPSNPRAQPWTGGGNYPRWSTVGAEGISGGAVKCVEIGKNTNGESTLLGPTLTLRDES
ncbi:ORF40t [Quillaja saponaria]|uniref:ORF40t n=1 Tax=Quillaja saponaria TaxID=32244 RepID=A0AAD7KKQ1_QUISA|nr:ORF40t [Quillaja saponaria]